MYGRCTACRASAISHVVLRRDAIKRSIYCIKCADFIDDVRHNITDNHTCISHGWESVRITGYYKIEN
jgi:hypothetical protein